MLNIMLELSVYNFKFRIKYLKMRKYGNVKKVIVTKEEKVEF